MKVISFKPEFIPLIKEGEKIVTRRINTKLKTGDKIYFKSGRTGKKEGYLEILDVESQPLQAITKYYNMYELVREGFSNMELGEFVTAWNKINRNKKGCKWADNPEVYRIQFKLTNIKGEI